jgi:hypothetical protein
MAVLSVQVPTTAGPTFTAAAAAVGGDSFVNTGVEFFYVKNGSGGALTVTFDSPGTCSFGLAASASHDLAVSVGAGVEKIIGPFPRDRFSDANGSVQVTYSGVTSLTVAVLRQS